MLVQLLLTRLQKKVAQVQLCGSSAPTTVQTTAQLMLVNASRYQPQVEPHTVPLTPPTLNAITFNTSN